MKGRDGYAPGSGELDSDRHPCLLRGLGHLGASGLEYVPAVDTMSSLRAIESIEGHLLAGARPPALVPPPEMSSP